MGGWGGWDDNVPWTCTHSSVGWVGGVGGMITFLGLAHILECGWGVGWVGGVGGMMTLGGWGGWDVYVPWTCTHSSLRMWWDSFDLHTY